MRTFIAIELPAETQGYLALIQQELKKSAADVKWVEPKNIHLTLRFLGELNEKKLPLIKEIVKETAEGNSPFSICLCCLGAFPSLTAPRVIWVGIGAGDKQIRKLAGELEERIAVTAGIPKEKRPFKSHLTLGRTRSAKNLQRLSKRLQELNLPENAPLPAGNNPQLSPRLFSAISLKLLRSTLTPRGAIYETLSEANLKTA